MYMYVYVCYDSPLSWCVRCLFLSSRLVCEVLDSFHFDVALSQYVETQTGKRITDGEETLPTNDADQEAGEQPSELPLGREPVVAAQLPAAAPVNQEVTDDVDEGIEVKESTSLILCSSRISLKCMYNIYDLIVNHALVLVCILFYHAYHRAAMDVFYFYSIMLQQYNNFSNTYTCQ